MDFSCRFGFLRPLSSDEKRVVNPIAKKVFKAAFVGNHSGEALLGLMFSKGWGMKRDRRMAVHWNRKSATGGDLDGQYQLGMNYLEGRGVRRDRDEASKYFFDAAHAGHPAAKNELGRMYNIPAWT
jgi:TPR repeat protein